MVAAVVLVVAPTAAVFDCGTDQKSCNNGESCEHQWAVVTPARTCPVTSCTQKRRGSCCGGPEKSPPIFTGSIVNPKGRIVSNATVITG